MGSRRGLVGLLAAGVLSLGTGCTASSDYMRPTAVPVTAQAKPGMATVAFLRPSGLGGAIVMTIIDEKGRFLGDSTANACFATQMPAGKYTLIGWAENTAAIKADLAADRVYFVEVSPRMGVWSARVQLLAVTPRSESWGEVATWLKECTNYEVQEAGGQAYLSSRRADVQERIRRGLEILTEYSPEELAERTLRPEDGIAPQGAAPAQPAPVAPAPAPAPADPAPTQPGAAQPAQPGASVASAPPAVAAK